MTFKPLPSMEHTFTIKVKGNDTGQIFEGTFTYKRPNFKAKSEISKTAARLGGGLANLDEDTKVFHDILATLRHTLIKAPEWWEKADYGFELYDSNVIFETYKACREFENNWFSKVWENKEPENPESKK